MGSPLPDEALAARFASLGLAPAKAKEVAGNKKLGDLLDSIVAAAGSEDPAQLKAVGPQLHTLASNMSKRAMPHLPYLSRAVATHRLVTTEQISAGVKYCESCGPQIADSDFDTNCGVGITVTEEQLKAHVSALFDSRKADLAEKRYQLFGQLLGAARNGSELKWANGQSVKAEIEAQLAARLGPRDERDDPKNQIKKKSPPPKPASTPATKPSSSPANAGKQLLPDTTASNTAAMARSTQIFFDGELARLHKPGENPQVRPSIMAEHLARTGGKVITRFPPEPNGFLHIGHAKAININFGYAQAHGGITYLRFDDTNPEAEEERYFEAIIESVRWLGFTPYKVTYSSDHFQRLYDLAVDLIKRDKAYVCECTGEEIRAGRGGEANGPRHECSHRSRPVAESLAEFTRMKEGKYKEGERILRMKMDMQNPNPQFWDLVAYRVLYTPHVRTGKAWCVYPTYDYTHCLVDSFEDITHSLCTTEFQLARESYYWLCDALQVYKPVQWEYGRLNIEHAVLSKRKIMKLVSEGIVSGWDDPRLLTLPGLRRRGYTPEAINAFVRELGVTVNTSLIQASKMETHIREHLNDIAPRLMAVLDPLKLTLTNLPETHCDMLVLPNKPRTESMGSHPVPFTKTLWIDASDFKPTDDDPNFYRLAPGKTVGLLYVPFPIKCTGVETDPRTGKVTRVLAEYLNDPAVPFAKPKTYIQWIADSPAHGSPVSVSCNLYGNLFKDSPAPAAPLATAPVVKGGPALVPTAVPAPAAAPAEDKNAWLKDVNPDSLVTVSGALVEVGVKEAKVGDRFQFVRIGYFALDQDSVPADNKRIFNRVVTLKEDSSKNVKEDKAKDKAGGPRGKNK